MDSLTHCTFKPEKKHFTPHFLQGAKLTFLHPPAKNAHECFYFSSHSFCCFFGCWMNQNLITHPLAYFSSIWLVAACNFILDQTPSFSLAASPAVEKLFLPAWTQYLHTSSPLLPVCSQPLLLLCVSHNAPCCLLFYSREHHNGCPLHYMRPAYSSGAAAEEFEYLLAPTFTTTSSFFWVVTVVTIQA